MQHATTLLSKQRIVFRNFVSIEYLKYLRAVSLQSEKLNTTLLSLTESDIVQELHIGDLRGASRCIHETYNFLMLLYAFICI